MLSEYLDVGLRLAGGIGLSGVLIAVIGKKVTPRRSPAEQHDSRVAELERAREQDRKEISELKAEFEKFREGHAELLADYRGLVDYTHAVRGDYATETGKSPRPWPEDVRL